MVSLVTFPLMFAFFILAPEIVYFIYGPKWYPLIDLIRILSFCGLIQSISTNFGLIYMSQGKMALQLKIAVINMIILTCVLFLACLNWGLKGVAIAYLIYTIVVSQISGIPALQVIGLRIGVLLRELWGSLIWAFLFFFVGLGILREIFYPLSWVSLIGICGVVFCLYFLVIKNTLISNGLMPERLGKFFRK